MTRGGLFRALGALVLPVLLAGCATQAVVADLTTDRVIVQAIGTDMEVIGAQARQGCAIHGRTPVPISHRCLNQYCTQRAYLFACRAEGEGGAGPVQMPGGAVGDPGAKGGAGTGDMEKKGN